MGINPSLKSDTRIFLSAVQYLEVLLRKVLEYIQI